MLLVLLIGVLGGNPADCDRIRDHDTKMICKAETTGNRSWCASIKNADLRARCYAVVKRRAAGDE